MISNQTTINGTIKDAAYTANGDIIFHVQIPEDNADESIKALASEIASVKKSITTVTRKDGTHVPNLVIEPK